ncbi:WW domain-binding protein 4 [Araneus ventricosus]|uniref:WW domain-binding protein 4 n=1 Tax=Araneus ventricosus TaxID=182803 RepID=A0A4Y2CUL4_ARAVE|nr:WW domain-binding protein 4 [Araneus ventricosus]
MSCRSEFWKSLPRKYCDICKCWFADNKASIEFHERGKRHQENAAKRIQDIQKRGIKDFKKQKKLEEDMEKIEKAALAAYQKDLQNNLEAIPNPNLANSITNSAYNVPEISKINKPPNGPKRTKESKTNVKKAKLSVNTKTVTVKKEISEESSNGVEVKQEAVPETRKWYEAMTDEGYKYYWHVETSESCWEAPEEGFVSLEEQEALNSPATTENSVPEIKEEPKEEVEENNTENEEEPVYSIGPQPKVDPYGQWVTVVKKEPVKIDLQLPKPSEDLIEIVIPVVKDEPKLKFSEKIVGKLEDTDPSEGVTFKKRKFAGSSAKRNARQRNLDDD